MLEWEEGFGLKKAGEERVFPIKRGLRRHDARRVVGHGGREDGGRFIAACASSVDDEISIRIFDRFVAETKGHEQRELAMIETGENDAIVALGGLVGTLEGLFDFFIHLVIWPVWKAFGVIFFRVPNGIVEVDLAECGTVEGEQGCIPRPIRRYRKVFG